MEDSHGIVLVYKMLTGWAFIIANIPDAVAVRIPEGNKIHIAPNGDAFYGIGPVVIDDGASKKVGGIGVRAVVCPDEDISGDVSATGYGAEDRCGVQFDSGMVIIILGVTGVRPN